MHRVKLLFIMTVICFAVIGCQKRDEASENEATLEAADIAKALGMNWWQVRLPADLDPNDFITVTYEHPDGSIESQGGSTGWQAGSIVKVLAWSNEDGNKLRYAVLHKDGLLKGSLSIESQMKGVTMTFSRGKILNAGDVLMKFSEKNVLASSEIHPGEIGLILHVNKNKYKFPPAP